MQGVNDFELKIIDSAHVVNEYLLDNVMNRLQKNNLMKQGTELINYNVSLFHLM